MREGILGSNLAPVWAPRSGIQAWVPDLHFEIGPSLGPKTFWAPNLRPTRFGGPTWDQFVARSAKLDNHSHAQIPNLAQGAQGGAMALQGGPRSPKGLQVPKSRKGPRGFGLPCVGVSKKGGRVDVLAWGVSWGPRWDLKNAFCISGVCSRRLKKGPGALGIGAFPAPKMFPMAMGSTQCFPFCREMWGLDILPMLSHASSGPQAGKPKPWYFNLVLIWDPSVGPNLASQI